MAEINPFHLRISIPGNDPVNVDTERLAQLRLQLAARLRPVLRQQNYEQFDLERAFAAVTAVSVAVKTRPMPHRDEYFHSQFLTTVNFARPQ